MAYDVNELLLQSEELNKKISDGIEKNRKGDFYIKTAPGTKVSVKLKNHKFRFGANLFMLDEIPGDKEKNEIYKTKFAEVFNMATIPFYWQDLEPKKGQPRYDKNSEKIYRRPPIDLCMEFCKNHGIEPREHALCYNAFFPDWLKNKPIEEEKFYIEKRMQEISARYKNDIKTIEVTNEMWQNGKTDFYKDPEYIDFCFKTAEKYFPENTLAINEWTGVWEAAGDPWDNYYAYIESELLKGGRIDAIGMQYHVFVKKEEYFDKTRKLYDLNHLYDVLLNYARFNKEIQITEVTVPAFTEDIADETLQADIIEKLYSLWFSFPNVSQIIYWNLIDGYAAFTTPGDMSGGENYYRGGLLRFNMTEKPAYSRIKRLIKEVWTTNGTLTANDSGLIKFRGFYGEYDISDGIKTISVNFDEDKKEVVL